MWNIINNKNALILKIVIFILAALVLVTSCASKSKVSDSDVSNFNHQSAPDQDTLPEGFVYVTDVIPTVQLEIRYFSEDNFVGII